jgi:ribosome-associated translation inhibitor RaiA
MQGDRFLFVYGRWRANTRGATPESATSGAKRSLTMRLHVKKRGTNLTPEDTATVERRVHFALGRFGHRIRRAEVLLVDSNGPRGGLDQHCTVHVVLAGLSPVVVEVVDVDPLTAVSRAVERVARRIRDSASRRRDMQRQPARGTRADVA